MWDICIMLNLPWCLINHLINSCVRKKVTTTTGALFMRCIKFMQVFKKSLWNWVFPKQLFRVRFYKNRTEKLEAGRFLAFQVGCCFNASLYDLCSAYYICKQCGWRYNWVENEGLRDTVREISDTNKDLSAHTYWAPAV